jgi:hypothetical protein
MPDGHKFRPDREVNVQLLPAFAPESLLLRRPRLHLAADEFPEQAPSLMRRPLADQKPIPIPNQRRNYFNHIKRLADFAPAGAK